ncbi:hypothetical protein MYX82_02185 [Acidobacteria bacterium AH-259-D05]|nr:hypothetical protein [Acidobacteria bacterium AH-259-D05]
MGKKYLSGSLFDVAAASVALFFLESQGKYSLEELAEQVWHGYSDFLVDDGATGDLSLAAQKSLEYLKDKEQIVSFALRNFRYWRAEFRLDGSRRHRWPIFRGLLFNKELRTQDKERVAHFLTHLEAHRMMIDEGRAPSVPEGWNLQ